MFISQKTLKIRKIKRTRVPPEIIGEILEFCLSASIFNNIICLSKEVHHYIMCEHPGCLKNINFSFSYILLGFTLSNPINHVFSISIGLKTSTSKVDLGDYFPNLNHVKELPSSFGLYNYNFVANNWEKLKKLEISSKSMKNIHIHSWKKFKNLEYLRIFNFQYIPNGTEGSLCHLVYLRREIFRGFSLKSLLLSDRIKFQKNYLGNREVNPMNLEFFNRLEEFKIFINQETNYLLELYSSSKKIIDNFFSNITTLKRLQIHARRRDSTDINNAWVVQEGVDFSFNRSVNLVDLELFDVVFKEWIDFSSFPKLKRLKIFSTCFWSDEKKNFDLDEVGNVFITTIRDNVFRIPNLKILGLNFKLRCLMYDCSTEERRSSFLKLFKSLSFNLKLKSGKYLNSIEKVILKGKNFHNFPLSGVRIDLEVEKGFFKNLKHSENKGVFSFDKCFTLVEK